MALMSNLPGVDALGGAGSTDVQRIQAVLTSNSVADEVIEKFELKERYGTPHIEHARAALADHCTTAVDRKSGRGRADLRGQGSRAGDGDGGVLR